MAPTPATAPSSAQALLGALAGQPGATAADLAEAAGIGRSTAGKLLASLQADGRVLRRPGGRQGGRRTADRWTLPTPPASPTQDPNAAAATAEAADADAKQWRDSRRLGAGELRQLVLGCLADRPGQSLSPTAIAKALGGRSAGAVANALGVLAGQGAVVQAQAKPRMYCINRERRDTIVAPGGDQAEAQR
jgi:predicted DNA-binding transcriptional regulator YafY